MTWPSVAFEGEAWRHCSPYYDPLIGEGARRHGGRFNQRGIPTLRICGNIECVQAEYAKRGLCRKLPASNLYAGVSDLPDEDSEVVDGLRVGGYGLTVHSRQSASGGFPSEMPGISQRSHNVEPNRSPVRFSFGAGGLFLPSRVNTTRKALGWSPD